MKSAWATHQRSLLTWSPPTGTQDPRRRVTWSTLLRGRVHLTQDNSNAATIISETSEPRNGIGFLCGFHVQVNKASLCSEWPGLCLNPGPTVYQDLGEKIQFLYSFSWWECWASFGDEKAFRVGGISLTLNPSDLFLSRHSLNSAFGPSMGTSCIRSRTSWKEPQPLLVLQVHQEDRIYPTC